MKATFTFQTGSTIFDATPEEVKRIVPTWAKYHNKKLNVLVWIGQKWHLYKVFNPTEA